VYLRRKSYIEEDSLLVHRDRHGRLESIAIESSVLKSLSAGISFLLVQDFSPSGHGRRTLSLLEPGSADRLQEMSVIGSLVTTCCSVNGPSGWRCPWLAVVGNEGYEE
jgi:hypothetical protein